MTAAADERVASNSPGFWPAGHSGRRTASDTCGLPCERDRGGPGQRLKEFRREAVFNKGYAFNPRNDPSCAFRQDGFAHIGPLLPGRGPGRRDRHRVAQRELRGILSPAKPPVPKPLPDLAPAAGNTVLVMPFSDHGPEGDQQDLCEGLRQESCRSDRGRGGAPGRLRRRFEPDPRAAASRIGAALIVSGSIRKAGGEVRITTNVIDAASDRYVWSMTSDGKCGGRPRDQGGDCRGRSPGSWRPFWVRGSRPRVYPACPSSGGVQPPREGPLSSGASAPRQGS